MKKHLEPTCTPMELHGQIQQTINEVNIQNRRLSQSYKSKVFNHTGDTTYKTQSYPNSMMTVHVKVYQNTKTDAQSNIYIRPIFYYRNRLHS